MTTGRKATSKTASNAVMPGENRVASVDCAATTQGLSIGMFKDVASLLDQMCQLIQNKSNTASSPVSKFNVIPCCTWGLVCKRSLCRTDGLSCLIWPCPYCSRLPSVLHHPACMHAARVSAIVLVAAARLHQLMHTDSDSPTTHFDMSSDSPESDPKTTPCSAK